jgi:hypothetical protein
MVPFIDKNGMKGYTITSDSDKVAGYDKALINYLFYNNSFCQAGITWRRLLTEVEISEIKYRLVQEWGTPDKEMNSDSRIVGVTWASPDKSVEATLGALDNVSTEAPDYNANLYISDVKCRDRAWRDNGL